MIFTRAIEAPVTFGSAFRRTVEQPYSLRDYRKSSLKMAEGEDTWRAGMKGQRLPSASHEKRDSVGVDNVYTLSFGCRWFFGYHSSHFFTPCFYYICKPSPHFCFNFTRSNPAEASTMVLARLNNIWWHPQRRSLPQPPELMEPELETQDQTPSEKKTVTFEDTTEQEHNARVGKQEKGSCNSRKWRWWTTKRSAKRPSFDHCSAQEHWKSQWQNQCTGVHKAKSYSTKSIGSAIRRSQTQVISWNTTKQSSRTSKEHRRMSMMNMKRSKKQNHHSIRASHHTKSQNLHHEPPSPQGSLSREHPPPTTSSPLFDPQLTINRDPAANPLATRLQIYSTHQVQRLNSSNPVPHDLGGHNCIFWWGRSNYGKILHHGSRRSGH